MTAHRSFLKISLHTTWSCTIQTRQLLWFIILQRPQVGVQYSTGSLENRSVPSTELLGKFQHIFSTAWEILEKQTSKFRDGCLCFMTHGTGVSHTLFAPDTGLYSGSFFLLVPFVLPAKSPATSSHFPQTQIGSCLLYKVSSNKGKYLFSYRL